MKRQNGTETSAFGTNGRINHDSSKFYNSKLYPELEGKEVTDKTEILLPKEFENKLILGSAENMKELPNNSIHLMITSPPYNACLCTQLLTALTQNAQCSTRCTPFLLENCSLSI